MKVTAEQLLSERYAADRRALINDKALEPVVGTRATAALFTSALPTPKVIWSA